MGPEEAEYLRRELNNQLTAIHELQSIPLDEDITITSHGVPFSPEMTPELRSDEWQPYEEPGRIIQQAPQQESGYVVVPEIPHTELK
jgi:aspartyl/glutamyl-tRNA(Asn/Gln) amidotransferase C subunit